jgi:SAM-dependent methyltransferase
MNDTEPTTNRALTRADYWDGLYRALPSAAQTWTPRSYDERLLARALAHTVRTSQARSILEVGCGHSLLLTWLARISRARITGMDYSPHGCRLAEQRLADAGVTGRIVCADLFAPPADELKRHELVYSLGLVEHFSDTTATLRQLANLLAPGGTLLTVIPNLVSLHGWLVRHWQPAVARQHFPLRPADVIAACHAIGLVDVRARYLGAFSFDVVAWQTNPRNPRLARLALPLIRRLNGLSDRVLRMSGRWRGSPSLAPFFAVSARLPSASGPCP